MKRIKRTQTIQNLTGKGFTMDITKKYKYFDLETFEIKEESKTITFENAKDFAEAQARVGGDEQTLLKALNSYLRSQALLAAENEVTSKGGKKTVVLAVAKPFRAMFPFSQMYKLDANGKPLLENGEKVVDRKAQTKAILDMIKASPTILATIKNASSVESDENGEDEEEVA